MRKKESQRSAGFGAIGVVLVVVAVALVGFIAWRVYDAPKAKPTSSTQRQTSSTNQPSGSGKPGATPTDTATYLDIKELGVKIKLSDDIKDVTYYYDAAYNNSQYPNPQQVTISSKSLADKSGGSCAASSGIDPLGTIQKYSGNVDGFGRPLVTDGKTVFTVGDGFVALRTPQAACSSDFAVLGLASTQRASFAEAFKSVQPDK